MSRRQNFLDILDSHRYSPANNTVTITQNVTPMAHRKHYRAASKVERYIVNYVRERHLLFDREKEFPDLVDENPLRFDFYLMDYNLLVEVDGEQHYRGSMFHRTREQWMKQVNHDEMKNKYCKEREIHLLRIPTTCSTQETYCLLDRAISSIKVGERVHQVDVYFQKKAGIKIEIKS